MASKIIHKKSGGHLASGAPSAELRQQGIKVGSDEQAALYVSNMVQIVAHLLSCHNLGNGNETGSSCQAAAVTSSWLAAQEQGASR